MNNILKHIKIEQKVGERITSQIPIDKTGRERTGIERKERERVRDREKRR